MLRRISTSKNCFTHHPASWIADTGRYYDAEKDIKRVGVVVVVVVVVVVGVGVAVVVVVAVGVVVGVVVAVVGSWSWSRSMSIPCLICGFAKAIEDVQIATIKYVVVIFMYAPTQLLWPNEAFYGIKINAEAVVRRGRSLCVGEGFGGAQLNLLIFSN